MTDQSETQIARIEEDPDKAIRVDRDGNPAWVRFRNGEYEVYATTEGFIQDRILTTTKDDVRSKLENVVLLPVVATLGYATVQALF